MKIDAKNASQKQGDASLLKVDERRRLNNVVNNIRGGMEISDLL